MLDRIQRAYTSEYANVHRGLHELSSRATDAFEGARAVLTHAMDTLGLTRVAAIVSPGNEKSEALLGRLGMTPRRMVRAPDTAKDLQLYAIGRGEV